MAEDQQQDGIAQHGAEIAVEEIEKRQTAVSQELKDLRKEMAMCYAIARRSGAEEQNPIGKEQNEHEPRRRSSGTNRADVPQRS